MTWKRQLRTTLLLLLFIAGCLGVGYYAATRIKKTTVVLSDGKPVIQEVTDALQRYESRSPQDSALLRTAADDDNPRKAELAFVGLNDPAIIKALLTVLQENELPATFFITGEDATAYPESLSRIATAGFSVGIAYTDATAASDDAAAKRIISDFVRASASIQGSAGVWPSQILTVNEPGESLLAAAYACAVDTVVVPTRVITSKDAATEELARQTVNALPRQSILAVRLGKYDQATDSSFGPLCAALAATDLGAQAKSMMEAESQPAEPLKRVFTSERAAAFTFAGLGNEAELASVLSSLKEINGVGTFLITADEISRYPDEIRQILDAGHSLGISVQAERFSSSTLLLEELLKTRESIRTAFGDAEALAVRPAFGNASTLLKEACGAGGFTLLSSMVNAVRTDDIRSTDAAPVVEALFPADQGVLQRGEIVHFQMRQYQKSDQMLGDMVKLIAANHNIYALKPVMELVNNTADTYQYPLPASEILPAVLDKIYPGQLSGSEMTAISTRYIGVDWISTSAFLPGFSATEIKRLDKTGLVPNKDNMVFLTFDDWGTDKAITELLDVLKAHKAKATFFIRTENVVFNPNLLRAIAADGHTIGCHTHKHMPLSNDDGSGKKYTELTDAQVAELKVDLVTSYQLLQSIVGDMTINGKPALSLLFRPPTLAVSKKGLAAVLDCGFTYSVSGTYSSQDYKAKSATKLASDLMKYTKSGAVLVMHMSDSSIYTAEALDIYLSAMERKAAEKPYQYVGLSEVLQ
ncbi:MAG: polysaccharide deacetylase family protein [Clostridiales bacterium]|nr:polysaccharide deacetylase family protein [Clostridiales bacterium]